MTCKEIDEERRDILNWYGVENMSDVELRMLIRMLKTQRKSIQRQLDKVNTDLSYLCEYYYGDPFKED